MGKVVIVRPYVKPSSIWSGEKFIPNCVINVDKGWIHKLENDQSIELELKQPETRIDIEYGNIKKILYVPNVEDGKITIVEKRKSFLGSLLMAMSSSGSGKVSPSGVKGIKFDSNFKLKVKANS